MKLDARNFAERLRDPVWERDLARQLRQLPELERFQFLNELLPVQVVVALDLAQKCLSDKRYFEVLLERGLRDADASSIRDWLKCVMPRLGFRRVVHLLNSLAPTYPRGVENAKYWLPEFSAGQRAA